MKTFIITTPRMPGELTFIYNECNALCSFNISEPLTVEQYNWLIRRMPWWEGDIYGFVNLIPGAVGTEKKLEVTFTMFWDRYNDKVRSSKKKTETAWNKMKEADQLKAYLYIPTYNRNRGTADKKYATTYLNDELWNN